MASEKKNSKKLNNLNYILYFAIGLLFITLCFYFYNFNNGLSDDSSNWGTFGDFIGGTLNPIFALFSLFAIIYTIKIQTEELELSREELKETKDELKESRIAQQEQSKSLKLQNIATELQIFENTFFQLINLFCTTRDNFIINIEYTSRQKLLLNKYSVRYTTSFTEKHSLDISGVYKSVEAIKWYLKSLKEHYTNTKDYNYNLFNKENEEYTGSYFGQIYQLLKFIDNSNIIDKQRYVNIFRAQFTKDELEFLFYHCLGNIGKKRFKGLVERYEFFEHIILNNDIEKQLLEYDIKAFGKNEKILEKYNELKNKS